MRAVVSQLSLLDPVRCRACGKLKLPGEFQIDRTRGNGLRTDCKLCRKETRRSDYVATRERTLAVNAAWHARHREEHAAMNERWRRENRARHRELVQRWNLNHPQVLSAYRANRRARQRGAPGWATPEQIQARIDYYGGRCWMCRADFDALDHVKPLARGGSSWPANLRPACTRCNASKGDRWPLAA